MKNALCEVRVGGKGLEYVLGGGKPLVVAWPVFEIDGRASRTAALSWVEGETRTLANGCVEYRRVTDIRKGLAMTLVVRIAPDSPVVRFRYELSGGDGAKLTKSAGRDALLCASVNAPKAATVTEVRLSEWVEMHHTYELHEMPVRPAEFEQSSRRMGPILAWEDRAGAALLAYEHGSTLPDLFLAFDLAPDRRIELKAVKGTYCDGQSANGFATPWMIVGAVNGALDQLAASFRQFILTAQATNLTSRRPYIFYNTWNYQERNKHWYGKPYLAEMNNERMLKEIDRAHEIGIDVFVIDTGWFTRTGDWRINLDRFPDGMKEIRERLQRYGMKLGLWFDNSAGTASEIGRAHVDCRVSRDGKVGEPHVIWETEPAHRMCLVSRYWEAFANELIRLHRELGVSYFKWDAIGQYECNDPHHLHGTDANSGQERADSYAYQLPLYMARIVEKVTEACPEAIVDFDVTERGRAVGLTFLSAGKFFLINNGPYCWNYNVPEKAGWPNGNPNLFFFAGPARTWICRQATSYDKWLPLTLFMTHYLPDDPATSQDNCVASLILGQNGIWGDLPAISEAGVKRMAELIARYKQVREEIASASPVHSGMIGGSMEVHEKLTGGRGAVVMFVCIQGTYEYITSGVAAEMHWASEGVVVTRLADGRMKITATFRGSPNWGGQNLHEVESAKLVFFGVS